MPTLIAFAGLPGTGKTAVARELARALGAVYLRIDSIEQAIRDSGMDKPTEDRGYRVAYAIAEENLRVGRTVVADCVNPLQITRDAWVAVAGRTEASVVEVQIICSDSKQHQQRIEDRDSGFDLSELDYGSLRSAADVKSLPKPEPRAVREHIVVPSIRSREVACAQRSGVRHREDAL